MPWLTFLPLFPYLLLMHAWWLLRHTLWVNCKEDPYNLVAPGLYCGRFPMKYPGEFPVEATVQTKGAWHDDSAGETLNPLEHIRVHRRWWT